jgi:MFS transporter, PAT family, beta-lactamase induction signal transducer AmpG
MIRRPRGLSSSRGLIRAGRGSAQILAARGVRGTIEALQRRPDLFAVFTSRRMAVLFLLGFSSGLPNLLTSQTLQAWMDAVGLDLGRIANLNAIGLAYTLKFLWAPLFDRWRLPFLGRRRGWLLALQLLLIGAIATMGTADPLVAPYALFLVALGVAFLSASLDVVIDAYNADILAPHERSAGVATYVFGYRISFLASNTVALVLADHHVPWRMVYALMAGLMVLGILGTLLAEEPAEPKDAPRNFGDAVVQPIVDFWQRLGGRTLALLLAFTVLYRFGDYFAQSLVIAFFRRGAGFSLTEVALVNKGLGVGGMAIGGLLAGTLAARFGLRRLLVAFGVMAAITNLLYMWLAWTGPDLALFCVAVGVDNATTALGTAAFVSVLMSATSRAFSATQFAVLTSLSSVGQRVFGALFAGDLVASVGWPGFFASTAAMAIPGLFLAWKIGRTEFVGGDQRNFAPTPADP